MKTYLAIVLLVTLCVSQRAVACEWKVFVNDHITPESTWGVLGTSMSFTRGKLNATCKTSKAKISEGFDGKVQLLVKEVTISCEFKNGPGVSTVSYVQENKETGEMRIVDAQLTLEEVPGKKDYTIMVSCLLKEEADTKDRDEEKDKKQGKNE